MKVAIVGAGFSGAVLAERLAAQGFASVVFESRDHVAGNCHTYRDEKTGILIHAYGPHIFHTSDEGVWEYVRKFDEFMPFINRVKSVYRDRVYSLPVNLMTINQFFDKAMSPAQARAYIDSLGAQSGVEPVSFEDQALRFVGRELYEAFFRGYTLKQWGIDPQELPASILKRLPVRFNYDDNYYSSRYQGMPRHGYSHVVERMLEHPLIEVRLGAAFERVMAGEYDRVFYTGPIDAWFGYEKGRLGYRTLDFVQEYHQGDYQGNAVINYPEACYGYTRIAEHKHFAPWESHEGTVVFKEYSRLCEGTDTPYYPIRLVKDKAQLREYVNLAKREGNVTFLGRLGTYRYLDMHVSIREALDLAERFVAAPEAMPAFNVEVL